MRPHLRARIAAVTIACVVAPMFAGCSKPIDPQSSVPAVYQPLVFIAAAVGVGILVTSHSHKNTGGGTPPPPNVAAPALVGALGNTPFDLALDFSTVGNGGVGALGTAGGGGNYGFVENLSFTSPGNNGSYQLPVGYKPIAVAIDGNGNDWFVDANGNVKRCPPPSASTTICVPTVTLSDGLGSAGNRTIAADTGRVFIAQDNLSGTVSWVAYALDGTGKVTGSYTYSPGLSMYNADAAMATLGATGIYTIFHKDGTSWKVAIPSSAKNSFTLTPVPLPNQNVASDGLGNNYGVLGSPASGPYELGHYPNPPGSLASTIIIAFNGQSGLSVSGGLPFQPPVRALHLDSSFIYMLDSSGNLVLFNKF